jgi:hypothetical protein
MLREMLILKKIKDMKRLPIVIIALLLFASCENRNGGEQTFQSVECDPLLDWLEQFIPMPVSVLGDARNLPAQDPAPMYYEAYQYSDFLRITVPTEDTLQFMHHFSVPCAYSVQGCVVLRDNVIELSEKIRKPIGIIMPCICGTTITTRVYAPHLNYTSIFLPEYELTFPLHLYEGLDTLIMIYTDVPEEPTVYLTVSGLLLDSYGRNLREAQVVLQDQSSTILDTLYTNRDGYFHNNFIAIDKVQASDTLSVIVLEPFHNYYDTTKIAFVDMHVEYNPWYIHYYASIEKQLKKK